MDPWKAAIAVIGFLASVMVAQIIETRGELEGIKERLTRIEALHEPTPQQHIQE